MLHSSISWQTIFVGSVSLSHPISHSQSKHVFVKHLACGGSVEHSRPPPTWPAGHFLSSQTGKYKLRIFVLSFAFSSFLIHKTWEEEDWRLIESLKIVDESGWVNYQHPLQIIVDCNYTLRRYSNLRTNQKSGFENLPMPSFIFSQLGLIFVVSLAEK